MRKSISIIRTNAKCPKSYSYLALLSASLSITKQSTELIRRISNNCNLLLFDDVNNLGGNDRVNIILI